MAIHGLVAEGGEGDCCWSPHFPRTGEVMASADLTQQHVEGPETLEAVAVLWGRRGGIHDSDNRSYYLVYCRPSATCVNSSLVSDLGILGGVVRP